MQQATGDGIRWAGGPHIYLINYTCGAILVEQGLTIESSHKAGTRDHVDDEDFAMLHALIG